MRTIVLFARGDVLASEDWKAVHDSYVRSIRSVDFPQGSGTLTLRRKSLRPDGQWTRNGVVYLKRRFLDDLVHCEGWQSEAGFDLGTHQEAPSLRLYPALESYAEPITSGFGNFDFVTVTAGGVRVAIEWETGNISSSHRSMNKLAIAVESGQVQAGVLIVPSRALYQHLTDRIGNIGELSGYMAMWRAVGERVSNGLLAITVVEHDALTDDVAFPYLPTGNDGRAREGRLRRL